MTTDVPENTRRTTQMLTVIAVAVGIVALLIIKGMTAGTQAELPPEIQLQQALDDSRPVAVFFHSTNCDPCMQMIATVGEVYPQFADDVVLVDVNVSDTSNHPFLRQQGIRMIPSIVFYESSGQAEIVYGVIPADQLQAHLQSLVEQ